MLRVKLLLARLARGMSRRLGRGGGTTLPGRLLLRLDSRAIARLGARLDAGTVLLSATNGKTTTTSMIAGILERAGRPEGRASGQRHGFLVERRALALAVACQAQGQQAPERGAQPVLLRQLGGVQRRGALRPCHQAAGCAIVRSHGGQPRQVLAAPSIRRTTDLRRARGPPVERSVERRIGARAPALHSRRPAGRGTP